MAVTLALCSALAYGVCDFLGGLLSRRASAWQVAIMVQTSSAAFTWLAVLVTVGQPTREQLLVGALAGVANGMGTAFLYRGFARGRMGVVAPVSALGSALVPLVVGLAQGDEPSRLASLGVVCALPAIWLIARPAEHDHADGPSGLGDALLAGLGFGVFFGAIGQVPDDAGFTPLALCQTVSIAGVVGAALLARERDWRPRGRAALSAAALGPLGLTATATFMIATQHGMLSLVSVIAALYPASTVLLAWLVLKERIGPAQAVGLAAAAVAVSLVALG
ncbi:MAG: DMT family transporter [Aeromicrobium sp.]|uniref:EamA family transporter n=1 Tax=Aeromicrobium sp. TaxID=1871063 RepID=UPI0039E25325